MKPRRTTAAGVREFSQPVQVDLEVGFKSTEDFYNIDRLNNGIGIFGSTIESVLIKYGKNIVDEQFILNRLAQAAMDIYTMSVILSRASLSASKRLPSADHELLMAQVWCAEASSRVAYNLKVVKNSKSLDVFTKLSQISRNVCDARGIVQMSPLGL